MRLVKKRFVETEHPRDASGQFGRGSGKPTTHKPTLRPTLIAVDASTPPKRPRVRKPRKPVKSPAPWLMPQLFVDHLGEHGMQVTGSNRTFANGKDGDIQPGQVVQYASIKAMKADAAAGLLPPGTIVMYDLEPWDATPQAEQDKPYEFMRKFVNAAHDYGLLAMIAPNKGHAEKASRIIDADIFLAQVQSIKDPKEYRAFVRKLALNMHPGESLVAELSTGRVDNAEQLRAQWRAARPFVGGFSLWYGNTVPPDGKPIEEQAAMATEFLNMVAATEAAERTAPAKRFVAKYSPDQPRDESGRFGEGSGSAAATTPAPTSTRVSLEGEAAGLKAAEALILHDMNAIADNDRDWANHAEGRSLVSALDELSAQAVYNNHTEGAAVFASFIENGDVHEAFGPPPQFDDPRDDPDVFFMEEQYIEERTAETVAQVVYEATQAGLKAADVPEEVTLYRGIRGDELTPHEGLNWCTTDLRFAQAFAGAEGHVFAVAVPREAVMYTSFTAPAVAQNYAGLQDEKFGGGRDTATHPDEWAVRASAIKDGVDVGPGRNASWLQYDVLEQKARPTKPDLQELARKFTDGFVLRPRAKSTGSHHKYDPDQPRDDVGRWTDGGGGGGGEATPVGDTAVGVLERPTASDVASAALRATIDTGGATINTVTGAEPAEGTAVATQGHELVLPKDDVTQATIEQYMADHADTLNSPNHYLGTWVDDDGLMHIDVSEIFPPGHEAEALAAGLARGELAGYDLRSGEVVDFPTGSDPAHPVDTTSVDVAANALADGKYVNLEQERGVSTLLDKLAALGQEARALGTKAPVYDLGKVTVQGTNLFMNENLGVSRAEMPQFTGTPEPGSPADAFPRDSHGEVDLSQAFIDHLAGMGVNVTNEVVPADVLRATQRELNGVKVAGMTDAIEAGTYVPTERSIWTTRDDYIVDGHHTWAAATAASYELGEQLFVRANMIDMPITDALREAKQWTADMGIGTRAVGKARRFARRYVKYSEDQPRDERGRFGETSGSGVGEVHEVERIAPGPGSVAVAERDAHAATVARLASEHDERISQQAAEVNAGRPLPAGDRLGEAIQARTGGLGHDTQGYTPTDHALIVEAIEHAPENAPALFRGFALNEDNNWTEHDIKEFTSQLVPGAEIEMRLGSWTQDKNVVQEFAGIDGYGRPVSPDDNRSITPTGTFISLADERVVMVMDPGSRSLNMQPNAEEAYRDQAEWASVGRFQVVQVGHEPVNAGYEPVVWNVHVRQIEAKEVA